MDRAKLYGIVGSAVFCLLTILVLLLVYMPELKKRVIEEEGILVSFGDGIDGSGFGDNPGGSGFGNNSGGLGFGDMIAQMEAAVPPAAQQGKSEPQEFITQQSEKTIALSTQAPKTTQKKPTPEEIRQQEQRTRDAREATAAETRRQQEAAAARQRQEATERADNLMGGAFGNGGGAGTGGGSGTGTGSGIGAGTAGGNGSGYGSGSGLGSGNTSGDTRMGNPAGSGTSGGHGWSLSGRKLIGSLATPNYPSNVEGRVAVEIRVDASGKVTNATIGSATNISDVQTRNAALTAARNTSFSQGSGVSVGTITYNFRLK